MTPDKLKLFVKKEISSHVQCLLDNHDFWDDYVEEKKLTEEDVDYIIKHFTTSVIICGV